jgi:cellulose synthase/poly-beta-1,6-N-acetylglucosamine synthase-like glycosyltransferase
MGGKLGARPLPPCEVVARLGHFLKYLPSKFASETVNLLYLLLPFLGLIPVAYLLANVLLSRSYAARRTRSNVPPAEVTIVLPVYAERVDVFEECITSVATQGSPWVVVGDTSDEPYRSLVERLGGRFLYLPVHSGKKRALATALDTVRTPFVLLVDSDTVLPPGAVQRLASHFSPEVGGVGASLSVRDTGTSFARSAEFVERAREVVLKAMSTRGSVLYLDGACSMYRTEVIRPYVGSPEFQNTTVLGRPTPLGDDWLLTDYLLREGYRTVRAYDTRVTTYPKESFSAFVAQNVRWSRSNWIRLGSYVRKGLPRSVGRFYLFEVAGTYLLPLIAVVTIVSRLPYFTHVLAEAPASLGSVGLLLLHVLVPVSRELWSSLARVSLTVLGVFATGAFVGAVARDHPGPRWQFVAYGALGAAVLFAASVYGLLTFWKRTRWHLTAPSGSASPRPSSPLYPDHPGTTHYGRAAEPPPAP